MLANFLTENIPSQYFYKLLIINILYNNRSNYVELIAAKNLIKTSHLCAPRNGRLVCDLYV